MSRSKRGRSRAERTYAAMLRTLPAPFRQSYGSEIEALFGRLYREARRRGRAAAFATWVRSTLLLLLCALRERTDGRSNHPAIEKPKPSSGGTGRGPDLGDVMGGLRQDLAYAFRSFRRQPLFALTAMGILAVGIGATTTIFSVVDTVLLRGFPYPHAERFVYIDNGSHSPPDFKAWDREVSSFDALAGVWSEQVDLTGDGEPEELWAGKVTPDYFGVLGVRPFLGRLFVEEDHRPEPAVVVLSHAVWARRWGSDPSVVGRRLTINGHPMVVAGVTNPEFRLPDVLHAEGAVDLFLPMDLDDPEYDSRGWHILSVVARLSEGASIEAAQAEVDAVLQRAAEQSPEHYYNSQGVLEGFPLIPFHEASVRRVSSTLLMLLGAVGLMLLIACANVANLMLARGTARAREVALRGALGASRRRIVAQLLTESVVLAVLGGALGVGLAFAGVEAFARFNPGGIPRLQDLSVDPRILIFALLASAATGILFGILPALQASRPDANEALKQGSGSVTPHRRSQRLRSALVAAEMAVALILLMGAGLLFRSLTERLAVDPGFRTEQLAVLSLNLGPTYEDEERTRLITDLLAQIRGIPGVRASAAGATVPFTIHGGGRCCWRTRITPEGWEEEEPFRSIVHLVSDGYFDALGAPLAFGREFTEADGAADPSVVVLNRQTAARLFGTENAVGRRLQLGGDWLTVVGVAEGVHHWGLDQDVEWAVYVPHARYGGGFDRARIAVRSDLELAALVPALREAVWSLAPDQPIGEITTMTQMVSGSVATPRFLSILLGTFAGVALLLACGGIYSSMLYTVGQRRRELGIRLALGADRSDVVGLILRQGLKLTVAGMIFGGLGALALSRVLESLVWGVTTTDPATLLGTMTLLGAVALTACWAPARRAAHADPLESLRAE